MAIKRALISVSDKAGIEDFGKFLHESGVEILSTGGTSKALRNAGIPVIDISDHTGFPEMLDGRVKTLHPKVHGGILYIRGNDEHEKTVAEHNIGAIDLVVVNLYPFAQVLSRGGSEEELIENIDIGGPSMVRSAAKNCKSVTVVTEVEDYERVMNEMKENNGATILETRMSLMAKAFSRTAEYDSMIAQYFCKGSFFSLSGREVHDLRYGENPHQDAQYFQYETNEVSLPKAKKLQGKELSYNNILDTDAALRGVLEFTDPSCVIVKHLSPCGVGTGDNTLNAYENALASDPISAFGGVVACNTPVDADTATKMNEHFLEIIIAPSFTDEAKKIFAEKENLRLLEIADMKKTDTHTDVRTILGGFVMQKIDSKSITEEDLEVVTENKPTAQQMKDLLFAWKAVKTVKSNAIVLAKDGSTIGIGGGLTSRVDASELAVKKAGARAQNAVAASDAFFPFADGPEALGNAGIKAIIQPGGSKRDQEVIDKCNEMGIAMVFTKTRAFRH